MSSETMSRQPITVKADDIMAAQRMDAALRQLDTPDDQHGAAMLTMDGTSVEVAPFLVGALRQLVALLAQGDDVALVPMQHDVSLAEAGELLNVSQPFLLNLLETGEIHAQGAGDHRRIPLRAVIEYKAWRHAKNMEDLATVLRIVQEAGAYD